MKREKLIKILNKEYPSEAAYVGDHIGLQLKGKEEINKIYVTLDITMKAIEEATLKKADLIISHHPLFYGERRDLLKEDLLKEDLLLKAKIQILEKHNINVYTIHTNADFNPISIAFSQATVLELENINQIDQNQAVTANLKTKLTLIEFIEYVKNVFNIKNKLKTNIHNDELLINNVIIASGAMGDLIHDYKYKESIFIIGELKYHHWIYANDNNIKVIEIGHQTEDIFVNMIESYLKEETDNEIEIILNKEEHVYRTI